MPQNLLRTDEIVDPSVRACFNFETQHSPDKRNVRIERTCLQCGRKEWVKVNSVREAAKHNHLNGMCLKCTGLQNSKTPGRIKLKRGGRIVDDNGYVMILSPDHPYKNRNGRGYVKEHRLVMEKILGRYLEPNESVHHKNGDRLDNRPENLELWVKTQPSGQRAVDLVIYAREILAKYGLVDATEIHAWKKYRGHPTICFVQEQIGSDYCSNWRYANDLTRTPEENDGIGVERPCTKCRHVSKSNGPDACLGWLDNVVAACCGHGVEQANVVFEDGTRFNGKDAEVYFDKTVPSWREPSE